VDTDVAADFQSVNLGLLQSVVELKLSSVDVNLEVFKVRTACSNKTYREVFVMGLQVDVKRTVRVDVRKMLVLMSPLAMMVRVHNDDVLHVLS
jgi:hypothetical protein